MATFSSNLQIVAGAGASKRNWWENPGLDGSFWVSPFYTTAQWTTSGAELTALRNGLNNSPTGYIHLPGDYCVPWYVGRATDPLVTVRLADGSKSIQVRIPVGATTEQPANISTDSSIGGCDVTQPYLVWSISGATINTGSVQSSGSVITGQYGLQIDDGAGAIMTDAVTLQPGTNNSIGGIQDYELSQARANPNYVIQHMLAYALDYRQMNNQPAVWPLKVIDTSFPNSGSIRQGLTIGIPASTPRPTGKSRGFYLLFDNLQQYGWFYYNQAGNGCLSTQCYYQDQANASLAQDCANSISDVMQYICILNNQTGLSSVKGKATGGVYAFTPPPPLDLSPTNGVNPLPSTFGAWYPSGFNAVT